MARFKEPPRTGNLVDNLYDRVAPIMDDLGCWEWLGSLSPNGYGRVADGSGKHLKAHRVSYELNVGPIPQGAMICHKCHNKLCVNPSHLYAGTATDNVADDIVSGTRKCITPEMRQEMLRMRESGDTYQAIANRYGFTDSGVWKSLNNGPSAFASGSVI